MHPFLVPIEVKAEAKNTLNFALRFFELQDLRDKL